MTRPSHTEQFHAACAWIDTYIDSRQPLTAAQVCDATGDSPHDVEQALQFLNFTGRIIKDPTGPVHGDAVAWIRNPAAADET